MLLSPIHCCDVTKPPYLLIGKLCTSPLHSNRLYVYTVCCRHSGQCFSVLRTHHTDVVGDSSGRSYVTEQGHNVPLLHTCALAITKQLGTMGFKATLRLCPVAAGEQVPTWLVPGIGAVRQPCLAPACCSGLYLHETHCSYNVHAD